MSKSIQTTVFTLIIMSLIAYSAFAADGWGENATGGQGGTAITVDNATDFETYTESASPYIIRVSGIIDIGGTVNVTSNKTIEGIDSSSTLIGQVGFENGSSNIIIQNLNITNPQGAGEGDGLNIKDEITDVFITYCSIFDCPDGCLDITNGSDRITVSWCKFYYTVSGNHDFVNLIGASDNSPIDVGKLNTTFHHNWWSSNCYERMPRVRYGKVHVYNNYYSCTGNNYCVRAATESQVLIENNYFNAVNNPINRYTTDALIETINNMYVDCTGEIAGGDNVFNPPYSYTLDDPNSVPGLVIAGAGNGSGMVPEYMHVDAVITGSESAGGGKKRGTADVTILDEYGGPVEGATVTGNFSGDFEETGRSAITNSDGIAHVVTDGTKKGGVSVDFCVSGVIHASQTYDEASNEPGTSCSGGPCTPTEVHVEAIEPDAIGCEPAKQSAQVVVTVVDNCGNPVSGALVDGTFTGDFDDVILDEVTDTNGQAVFISTGCLKKPSYTFCVDDVDAILPYNSDNNVEMCDSK
jgi:pectate lyase